MALEVSGDPEGLAEQMLSEAHELVVSGWCRGAGAQDEMGRPIEPSSAFARRWSAAGALERVWRRTAGDQDDALEAFERANLALAATVKEVPQRWNDQAERTHDEVLVALSGAQRFLDSLDRYEKVPGLIFEKPA